MENFLNSNAGIELTHAVIILILAVSGYIQVKSHRHLHDLETKMNGHLETHAVDDVTRS